MSGDQKNGEKAALKTSSRWREISRIAGSSGGGGGCSKGHARGRAWAGAPTTAARGEQPTHIKITGGGGINTLLIARA
jgi:hypothetical protein